MGEIQAIDQTWVSVTEGAEQTGYNRAHLIRIVMEMWKQPEKERGIRLRRHTSGYILWLPDLMAYSKRGKYGPQKKRKLTS